ncbi:sushi domain-containing protein 6 [Callorhinchus milii]|uniref:Sushi domain-containing protein n=1 Tax=Callorhinchus milii TaxID=7868 RepID=V9L126_CALMI|nr:sushi domain-containing protein 6 [Callorhinchus milii]|eukprot:gi/632951578/ref/XP_007891380.1/ PREDICTED: uncharacterized protein KIAA0247 homolog [Callorhinchus milii]
MGDLTQCINSRASLHLLLLLACVVGTSTLRCQQPLEPENGGFSCHPTHCGAFADQTVIEYFCEEGYTLKGDYKYLTCESGQWEPAMEISCRLNRDKDTSQSLGVPTLSIVASTASSVALILLLVVLFVLLQPKLKSFHHSRRDQGVSGDQASIVVDGVPVSLPSYEEAVYGSSGAVVPAADSRVQIVLAEGPGLEREPLCECPPPGRADPGPPPAHCEAGGSGRSETVLVHQPSSSSSSSSSFSYSHGRGNAFRLARASDASLLELEGSDVHSLLSLSSPLGSTDDIPLLKDA